MIEYSELVKNCIKKCVVDNLNFSVKGEIFAILGCNSVGNEDLDEFDEKTRIRCKSRTN